MKLPSFIVPYLFQLSPPSNKTCPLIEPASVWSKIPINPAAKCLQSWIEPTSLNRINTVCSTVLYTLQDNPVGFGIPLTGSKSTIFAVFQKSKSSWGVGARRLTWEGDNLPLSTKWCPGPRRLVVVRERGWRELLDSALCARLPSNGEAHSSLLVGWSTIVAKTLLLGTQQMDTNMEKCRQYCSMHYTSWPNWHTFA